VIRSTRLFGVALLCAMVLAGCTRTSLIYNRLPTLINWTIDDYITLDRAQQPVLDEQLDEYLAWHQTTQLPLYVALLDDVLEHLESAAPITESVLTRWQERADVFAADLQYRAVDWIVPMAQTATDGQRQELAIAIDKKQRELEQKYSERTQDEYRQDVVESLTDNLADYLGRLTEEQQIFIDRAGELLVRYDSVWLASRAATFARLTSILQAPDETLYERLMGFFESRLTAPTSAEYEHNQSLIKTTIAEVLTARTDKQHQKLTRRLSAIRDDLARLAAQAEIS
jgi:hypothetical protein